MTPVTCTRLTVLTVAGIFVQVLGLSFFVFGFFPVKPTLSGVSNSESYHDSFCDSAKNSSESAAKKWNESELPSEQLRLLYQELSGISPAFDRLVLMVIDGLPAEFVLGKEGQPPRKVWKDSMPYIQSLLTSGKAIGYHANAAPPTVTMPRLKAMVSGAVGGFLDVAFNFNTQALLDDNLLNQFFRIGWKMVMLGDDTWLKLFPGLFTRHDGVNSFFVKDTIEVDKNVSRHLPDELNNDEWNLLILHYLGLDHVGHIGGRNSPLMASKLKEMDDIVRTIHSKAIMDHRHDQGRTLLIVVSDHGMTENGNHGGSSYEETDSLMLFIGLREDIPDYATATNNAAKQVDLASTIAVLFGVPIPKNNVGILVPGTLEALKDYEQLRALQLNSWQLLRLIQAQLLGPLHEGFSCNDGLSECSGSKENELHCLFTNAAVLHGIWKSKNTAEDFSRASEAYKAFLRSASEWLASKTTEKPIIFLGVGVGAMLLSCLVFINLFTCLLRERKDWISISSHEVSLEDGFVLAVVLILVVSMGSSSMVEEEHYIWHFLTSTLHLLLLLKTAKSFDTSEGMNIFRQRNLCSIFLLLICGRLLRGWHQGGVNWTHLPDISKSLAQSNHVYIKSLHLISILSVTGLGLYTLLKKGLNRKSIMMLSLGFLVSGLLVLLHAARYHDNMFQVSDYNATLAAKVVYSLLATSLFGAVVVMPWSLHEEADVSLSVIGTSFILCWCLLQLLLQQPINSGPIFLLFVQILSLSHLSSKTTHIKEWVKVASLYYMGMAGHFSLGNSNTLATIDVAGAFIGISSHSTILSGILMFIITYASPMLFLLGLVIEIGAMERSRGSIDQLLKLSLGFPCLVPLCINSVLLLSYTIVLLLMSNHLFVWSVFSPKYLYVCATTICTYIGVCMVAATVAYTFCVIAFQRRRRHQH